MKTSLLKRINHKKNNLLRKYVPYNTNYRPKGVFKTSKEYVQSFGEKNLKVYEIYPDYTCTVTVPEDLMASLSPHHLHDYLDSTRKNTFINKLSYIVAAIPNGRVISDNTTNMAYVTSDGYLLEDISYQWKRVLPFEGEPENDVLSRKFFKKPTKINGTVFSMVAGSGSTYNISHWMMDAYPRIHLLKKAGLFELVDYFLVPSYQMSFQKESMDLLGIREDQIIEADEHTHIEADLLITSSHPRGKRSYINPQWVVDFYKNDISKLCHSQTVYPSLIYISRRDAKFRYVINEDEVFSLLKPYGFNKYTLSPLNFQEKVKLFSSAKVIISITGAGLSFFPFCNPGTKVVEMFAEGFVHTVFFDFAQKAGLECHPLVFETGSKATTQKQGLLENITVDLERFKNIIAKIL